MFSNRRLVMGVCGSVLLAAGTARPAETETLYAPPSADHVETQTLEWVAGQKVEEEAVLDEVSRLWATLPEDPAARTLLDRVIRTFTAVDAETKRFVEACRFAEPPAVPPESDLLTSNADNAFYTANLGLFYGRYLASREMYDEALQVFEQVEARYVVDPATYFFYKAVCEHELLLKSEALASLEILLTKTEDVPVSYARVAELMKYELERLRDESLDTVARLMKDVERRLGLGRGGEKVREREDKIVALLDKMIQKRQQQSGNASASAGGSGGGRGGRQSGSPAQDSRILGGSGPGEVDPEEFKQEGGWGALPPKEEARAKNLINRNFPGHYRQAVEQYFKKLAKRRAEGQ